MTLEYKRSVVMETAATTTENNKKYTAGTLGGEIVQSLDFAASLSSFFLCQFAAPILNLERGERSASIDTRATD